MADDASNNAFFGRPDSDSEDTASILGSLESEFSLPADADFDHVDLQPKTLSDKSSISLIVLPQRPHRANLPAFEEPAPRQTASDLEAEEDEVIAKPRTLGQLKKAKKRQETYLRTRRKLKRRKVMWGRLKVVLKIVFSVLLTVGLYYFVTAPFWQFSSKAVKFTGNRLITANQLTPFVKPYQGLAIFRINPVQLEREIKEAFPVVSTVYVRRHLFPMSLTVSVVEKPGWGLIYPAPPALIAPTLVEKLPRDSESKILAPDVLASTSPDHVQPTVFLHDDMTTTSLLPYKKQSESFQNLGDPLVIVSASGHIPGKRSLAILKSLVTLLDSQPALAKLQYVNISDENNVFAQFDGFTVRFGRIDSTAGERLNRLFSILPTIRDRQPSLKYVDLRWQRQIILKKKISTDTVITQPKVQG